jgi:hypothetical protein
MRTNLFAKVLKSYVAVTACQSSHLSHPAIASAHGIRLPVLSHDLPEIPCIRGGRLFCLACRWSCIRTQRWSTGCNTAGLHHTVSSCCDIYHKLALSCSRYYFPPVSFSLGVCLALWRFNDILVARMRCRLSKWLKYRVLCTTDMHSRSLEMTTGGLEEERGAVEEVYVLSDSRQEDRDC